MPFTIEWSSGSRKLMKWDIGRGWKWEGLGLKKVEGRGTCCRLLLDL